MEKEVKDIPIIVKMAPREKQVFFSPGPLQPGEPQRQLWGLRSPWPLPCPHPVLFPATNGTEFSPRGSSPWPYP